ncbi:MAG: hypothetical protein FJZ85_08110 [Chloroflexi bacterium]|nr:hypothetical protein [Chloroflexota bacterium]
MSKAKVYRVNKKLKICLGFLAFVFACLSATTLAGLFEKVRDMVNCLLYLQPICNTNWKIPLPYLDNWDKFYKNFQDYWSGLIVFLIFCIIAFVLAFLVLKDFNMGGQEGNLEDMKQAIDDLPNRITEAIKSSNNVLGNTQNHDNKRDRQA